MQVGQPVLISDHINLTSRSPLVGANFVDLTDLYSQRLRDLARSIDDSLEEGVYAAMPGPHFETPRRSGCCVAWVWISSACRPCWKPSQHEPPVRRCSGCRW